MTEYHGIKNFKQYLIIVILYFIQKILTTILVWANNGDTISRLYAGTQALLGDYTRTGQRSVAGLLSDGYNSAMRYVQNNFRDTFKMV